MICLNEFIRKHSGNWKKCRRRSYSISKYEDFCKDPKGYVKLIYEHLGIDGFEEAKPYFDAYLESQKNYKKNKFELTPRLRDKINAKLGFYFEHYGYEMQK